MCARERGSSCWADYKDGVLSFLLVTVVYWVGVLFFAIAEGARFSFVDSCYFTFTIMSTIGYGDLVVLNTASKIGVIVYSFLSVAAMGYTTRVSDSSVRTALLDELTELRTGRRQDRLVRRGPWVWLLGNLEPAKHEMLNMLLAMMSMLLIGVVTFVLLEGWSVLDSLIFSALTITTIGYSKELYPQSGAGRIVVIVYGFAALACLNFTLSAAQRHIAQVFEKKRKLEEARLYAEGGRAESMAAVMQYPRQRLKRTILLAVGVFMVCACSLGLNERWTLRESVFYCSMALATVGFPRPVPEEASGKLLTLAFLLVGMFFVGYTLAVIAAYGSTRVTERRKQVLQAAKMSPSQDWGNHDGVEHEEGNGHTERTPVLGTSQRESAARASSSLQPDEDMLTSLGPDIVVEPEDEIVVARDRTKDETPHTETETASTMQSPAVSPEIVVATEATALGTHDAEVPESEEPTAAASEAERLITARRIAELDVAELFPPSHKRHDLAIVIVLGAALLALMSIVFWRAENMNFLDSMYYAAVVITTVGFGDFDPKTDLVQDLLVVFAFISLGMMSYLLALVQEASANSVGRKIIEEQRMKSAIDGVIPIEMLPMERP